jgi:hypothetical protein
VAYVNTARVTPRPEDLAYVEYSFSVIVGLVYSSIKLKCLKDMTEKTKKKGG